MYLIFFGFFYNDNNCFLESTLSEKKSNICFKIKRFLEKNGF